MYTKALPCSIGCEELWAQGRAVPCAATATRGVEAAVAQLQRRLDICSVTSVISRPVCSRAGSPRSWRRRHHLPARRRVVAAVRRLARPRAQGAFKAGRRGLVFTTTCCSTSALSTRLSSTSRSCSTRSFSTSRSCNPTRSCEKQACCPRLLGRCAHAGDAEPFACVHSSTAVHTHNTQPVTAPPTHEASGSRGL